jgi:hypothetical protein
VGPRAGLDSVEKRKYLAPVGDRTRELLNIKDFSSTKLPTEHLDYPKILFRRSLLAPQKVSFSINLVTILFTIYFSYMYSEYNIILVLVADIVILV